MHVERARDLVAVKRKKGWFCKFLTTPRHPEERFLRRRISKCGTVKSAFTHPEILRRKSAPQDDGIHHRLPVVQQRFPAWALHCVEMAFLM